MSLSPRGDSLSLADRKHIDAICLQFEDAWLAGQRPVLEQHLSQASAAAAPMLLHELLLLDLDYRRSLQEPAPIGDYQARFPQFAEVIRTAFDIAARRDPPRRFLPGCMIGRYRVRRTLGLGAFAAVYLAWDEQLQREVALKIPHGSPLTSAGDRQRFLDEARTVGRLRHPRIVALYDAVELENGTAFLVMQHIEGQSLRDRLRREPLAPDQASAVAADVAEAIGAAHLAGVFHRDLKPSNILLDRDERPHVCDFGLALCDSDQLGRDGERAGTLAYMAPEQLQGRAHQLDGRADIWSLGVVLYEMLTGTQPFHGRGRQALSDDILHRDPRPPRQINADIPKSLDRICLRCLAKRPADRYATALDVADDLRQLDRPQRRRRVALLTAAAGTLLLLGVFLAGVWRDPPPAPPDVPLQGRVDLLIWGNEPHRQGIRLNEQDALPVRAGDQVRVEAQLLRPAYVYLLWLDTQNTLLPVYPWQAGDWNARPPERPQIHLALPDNKNGVWLMRTPHAGMETLVLLARHTPLPHDVRLRDLVATADLPTLEARPHASWFQEGRPPQTDAAPARKKRDPVLARTVNIHDPLLTAQQRLADALRPHFDLVYAVSFPVRNQ
ncbi:MAG: DUF4384 domain-containing protein [Planctomycetes bacterium]|nr:DUF4384 domain-containing protein [Planctomycetota bacterium]